MTPWIDIVRDPLPGRRGKPRTSGLTMVIDTGLAPGTVRDIVESAGDWIDYWKFGFGTSALYSLDVLHSKMEVLSTSGIVPYPGGTLFEIALHQGKADRLLEKAWELGFKCIEISDGTIEMDAPIRRKWIREAKRRGFLVLTETGKKRAGLTMSVEQYATQLAEDLACGADYAILEGRESGRNVGFYRSDGSILEEEIGRLMERLPSPDRVIWEAPQKSQQEFFLRKLGVNVNLGNIPATEVIALEALRRGLRSDTLRLVLEPDGRSHSPLMAGIQF